jgi:hypothetical protein
MSLPPLTETPCNPRDLISCTPPPLSMSLISQSNHAAAASTTRLPGRPSPSHRGRVNEFQVPLVSPGSHAHARSRSRARHGE